MQRLGKVLHITPSHNVVAKIENIPKIGDAVVDENMKLLGNVFDIIGPVNAPYAIIKTTIKDTRNLVNKMLYVSPSRGERRR
ncbi:MAG: H/ACA ribonucleoprotein complex subunit GAR1 [Candidatus Bathyarchaeia archaeon]